MTATDELRRMLDERGVEWDYGITGATTTRFSVNGIGLTFTPMRDGLVCSTILTPAEAIAATLGDADATVTRQGDADERNSKLFEAARKWMAKAAHFEAENAKLRELLQDYHRYEHEDCYSCRYIDECRADESGRCIAPMRLGERYRELGIEVDDGQQRDV